MCDDEIRVFLPEDIFKSENKWRFRVFNRTNEEGSYLLV